MGDLIKTKPERGVLIGPKADPVTAAITASLISAGASAAVASFIASVAVNAVISVGLSVLTGALSKKPAGPQSFTRQLRDRTLSARQPIAPRRIIYGDVRVGGTYTFIHTTGNKNQFINLVLTISGHEIDACTGLFFDGEEVQTAFATRFGTFKYFGTAPSRYYYETDEIVFSDNAYYKRTAVPYTGEVYTDLPEDTPLLWTLVPGYTSDQLFVVDAFRNFVYMEINLGTEDQTAFPGLVTEAPDKWTSAHRQAGCAGVYVRLRYDADKFPNGIPSITFQVRGKADVFDPRTSLTGYTNNAALCIADYVSLPQLGLGAQYSTEILDADLIEAANICDEAVALGAGGTEPRYEANGTIDTDSTPYDNIKSLTGAMGGAAITQGKFWSFRAGAYRAPEIAALTEDDFVGAISTQTLFSRTQSFNGVKGVFTSPLNSWQPDDFPAVQVPAYVAADNGEEVWAEVTLPFTTSVTAAQRISRLMLELQRRQITVKVPCKMVAYKLQPFDTVPFTIPRYGWTDKTFQVKKMQLIMDKAWSINLDTQEVDAAAYAWSTTDEGVYTADPKTTLPGSFASIAPGVMVADTIIATPTGGAATNLVATVLPPSDAFINEFEVEFKLSTDSEWIAMGRGSNTVFSTANVEDTKTYDVRARTINIAGVRSDWSAIRQHTIVGQTALPPDVTNFSISIVDGAANLSWNPVEVVDLSHYRIRHSSALSGATWDSSTLLVDRVGKPSTSIAVPALVGTYLIKAVDFGASGNGSDGRESQNAALIVSNVEALRTFNAIEAVEESPDWLGVKTQTLVDGIWLELDYKEDIFTRADFFGVSDFFLGAGGFYNEGWYEFENIIDLDAIYTSRVTAGITVGGENYNADLFANPDFFGVADFFNVDASQYGAELQISTTDDLAASPIIWSDWQPFVTGDYAARGLKFRLHLTSNQFGVTPVVSQAGVSIDMPDETRAAEDLVVTVAGLTVTFAPALRALKGLSISAQGLTTGDYYTITSKDAVGFDITFYDSSNTAVQRTFDYVAVGYGRVI